MAKEKIVSIIKPNSTILTPFSIEANRIKSNSQIEIQDSVGPYAQRLVTANGITYLQGGKNDRDITDQKMMLSGWYGTPMSQFRISMATGVQPQVYQGGANYDILHRGNMPTPEDIKAMAIYDRPGGDDCNNAILPGNYSIFANTANTPYGIGTSGSTLLVTRWGNGANSQMFFPYGSDQVFVRRQHVSVWQPWFELYSTSNKQPVGGMGLGIGDAPNATTITGGVRDFNLAKTNGNFTVDGSWANGTSNTPTATGHSGLLQIFQRAWDNMTVQKYMTWVTLSGPVNLTQNEFTRIWINNTLGWSDWLPSGAWDSVNTYRTGILRHNHLTNDDSVYPYVSYTKEKYRDTLAVGVPYTIGEISFRVGSTNRYDPHTADQLARVLGQAINTTTEGEYDGALFLASRLRRTDGVIADSSTLALRRDLGAEFTHSGKKVQINTGRVTAENFYQNTPQDVASNALTRVDYVKGLLAGSLSSIIPLGSTVDLDTVKTAGFYSQPGNVNATAANHYPVQKAGNLVVTVSAGVIQKYWVYNSSEVWSRAQYSAGAWTTWERDYNTAFKPTAADVGTLTTAQINAGLDLKADSAFVNTELVKKFDKVGGTLTGSLIVANRKSAIKVDGQSSISFQDQNLNMFHVLSFSNSLRISTGSNAENNILDLSSNGNLTVPVVLLNSAQSTNFNATTRKDYVDGQINTRLALSGGTMASGASLTFPNGGIRFYNGSNAHFWAGVRTGSNFAISSGGDFSTATDKFVVDAFGNTNASGNVNAAGSLVSFGGYMQIQSNANSILEFHNPGVTASMIYMTSSGQLRFGTSNGSAGETKIRMSLDTTGVMNVVGNVYAPAYIQTSDIRLKSNLVKIDSPLARCSSIDTYAYDKNGTREVGVVAQDIERALPEAVETVITPDGKFLGVNYGSIASLAIAAINELNQQVKELRDEVEMLKAS